MRHVDLAQVVQIARRRRLDILAALPAAVESPQVPPEARERIHRFLDLHRDVALAVAEMRPERFLEHLLERIGAARGGPLAASSKAAERSASLAWLQGQARAFVRRFPWANARELASHLLGVLSAGQAQGLSELAPGDLPLSNGKRGDRNGDLRDDRGDSELAGAVDGGLDVAALELDEGLVQLLDLDLESLIGVDHAYLVGLHAARSGEGGEEAGAAVGRLAELGCRDFVLSYPALRGGGEECTPEPTVERMRDAIGAPWQEMTAKPADPDETIEAALRAMRAELLDGVTSVGGRLRELRLDTEIDVSHGIVRYLELVKLAALLERPAGQSVAEALADVNARLLPAVTPLQREILESSTLDEELLAGRGLAQAGSALGRAEASEPSLQRFLPRKGGGLLLSASDIETYRLCPLRYKFARVLRIPAPITRNQRFGIALHQVLERYHAAGARTLPPLLQLFEECWRRAGFGADEQERALREKAVVALRRYHARLSEQRSEPVWFERMFSFALGRHHVRGRVDRVDRLPDGGYELIDYKTGRPKSAQQLREDIQLPLYAIAAEESWQLQASSEAYYYLLDDVKVPLPREDRDPGWVRETAVSIAEAILRERFEPTPSPSACNMCDYRIVCPVAEG
jgi:DNA helicase II / ATP-dependent DNA helicase PcrA